MTVSAYLLLVDDDVALRKAFSRALERSGYRVAAIDGSTLVIDLILERKPDMVLLDNHMPQIDGVQLIRLIRDRWAADELPIVLISGSSVQGEIDAAMQAGANDFRRKPVELADLLSTVQDVVGVAASRSTAEETKG